MEENTWWSLIQRESHYELPESSASRHGEDIQESFSQAPLDTYSSLGMLWGNAALVPLTVTVSTFLCSTYM